MSGRREAVERRAADGGGAIRGFGSTLRLILTQSALYGLAGGLGKALALVTVPILTRLLAPRDYGLADLANTLAGILVMVAMFAGDIPAARLFGRAREANDRMRVLSTYVWTTAVVSVSIGVILLPLAGAIATYVWASPHSSQLALLAIALIPVGAVQAALVATQRLESRPVPFAVLTAIDLLSQMSLAVLFVALGWGPLGMVAGLVIGSVIGLAAAVIHCWRLAVHLPGWHLGRSMVLEGLPFLPAALGFVIANYAVRYILVEDQGQAAVGLFGLAVRLAGGMALVTGAFSMAWGPYGLALPNSVQTAHLFGRVMRAFALVAVLGSLAVGAVAPEIITIVSGDAYLRASEMLPGLLISAAMAGGFYVLLVAAGVGGHGRAVAYAAVSGAVVQVAATALFLPWLGLQVVGLAAVAGQAVALIMLVSAVGSGVHRSREAVAIMCVGAVLAGVLQAANAFASSTFLPRAVVAFVMLGAAGVVGIRILHTARYDAQGGLGRTS